MSSVFFAKLVVAYLIGSLSGALILGRLRGVDIRTQGSGNAGGTNALRTQGVAFALGVVAIDLGKGALAAGLAYLPPGSAHPPVIAQALACGLAAAVGHVHPIFFGFRGGKGAATLFGALIAVMPGFAIFPLLAWVLTILVTGYVGLATVLAAIAIPLGAPLVTTLREAGVVSGYLLAMPVLIAWTHRENLRRLRAGTESRFERARVLGRLFDRDRPHR